MAKNKLQKFAELNTLQNTVQPELEEVLRKDHLIKGKWNETFFRNNNPIVLELGCGKGEYTVGLAEKFPDKNFIGIDIKGARMWNGAKHASETNLKNAGFLRIRIDHITSLFAKNEISEIWITFPDPQEKRDRAKKRLTSSVFLSLYQHFLKEDGLVHLKTDNTMLYEYTLRLCIKNEFDVQYYTNDLYNSGLTDDLLSIKTFYESQFLAQGIPIKYLRFHLTNNKVIEEPASERKK